MNPALARDQMSNQLMRAWAAIDWASLGLGIAQAPKIEWQGRGGDSSANVEAPYAICNIIHADQPQSSLSDQDGNKTWTASGIITIQCKGPLANGNGFEVAEQMAIIARNAYRGKQTPDCIWFRNPRIHEVGPDAGWFLFNTLIDFEYDEVG